ncbi:MAG: hypothetical protein ABJF10_15265 [Chthoniobacter sp.]|uniref:hypothetical protein n=1 Tax=Chthoniobacter sp. TaxID=2510640 RepID=UPI0032AE6634
MRGSPLARALLAFFVIALLGWPRWQLTRSDEAVAAPAPKAAAATIKKAIGLHLTFTTVPKSLAIKHLGEEVWKVTAPEADMEKNLSLDYPVEGVDLQFHIEWAEDAPLAALRVRLTDPAGDTHDKTVWGQGVVDEVVTFP